MSWLYLPPLAGDCSGADRSTGERSAPSKSTPTGKRCSSRAKRTAGSILSQSGRTLEILTDARGVDLWISSLADRPARPGQAPAAAVASAIAVTSGRRWRAWSAKSGRRLSGLRTSADRSRSCNWCGLTSAAWATVCLRTPLLPPPAWVRDIFDGAAGYLPTLIRRDGRTIRGSQSLASRQGAKTLAERFLPTLTAGNSGSNIGGGAGRNGPIRRTIKTLVRYAPTLRANERGSWQRDRGQKGKERPTLMGLCPGGALNPEWAEWYMGFPIGWTALRPLGMRRFRQWLERHGGC